MCEFISGYVSKNGYIFDGAGFTDSHSEIALIHNLRDSDVAFYAQNLAKWECTPPKDNAQWSDFSKWTVRADENETPAWFDPEKIRAHVAKLAAPWFVADARGVLLGGCWIFDGEKATVKQVLQGRIVAVINGATLSGANLYGANLDSATLSGANLSRATLSGATLSGANLSRANLYGANLYGATLSGATLSGANLYGANLSGATLSRATLSGANLYGANLYGATLDGANLYGANLDSARIEEGVRLPKGWQRSKRGIVIKDES
jgi:hypothetical protein